MKKINIAFIGIIFIAFAMVTGCKKNKDEKKDETTTKPNDQQGSTEADGGLKDVNDFINNQMGGGSAQGKISTYKLPCGAVQIDSSGTAPNKLYKIKYGSQSPCGYKKKSGQIHFELLTGTWFNQAGSIYKVTYVDYVVESLVDGSTVELDGYITVKNVNGGYVWEAVTSSSTIVHQLRGTFTVTFADGVTRDKSYYQLRTYTSNNSWAGLQLSIDGDSIAGDGVTKIYEVGRTYDGNYKYQTDAIQPYIWKNCGSTYAGPYILKTAHARLNVTIPFVTPAYVDVEGGYYWDYSNAGSTPSLVNDCSSNAYKITTVISSASTTSYQLY